MKYAGGIINNVDVEFLFLERMRKIMKMIHNKWVCSLHFLCTHSIYDRYIPTHKKRTKVNIGIFSFLIFRMIVLGDTMNVQMRKYWFGSYIARWLDSRQFNRTIWSNWILTKKLDRKEKIGQEEKIE